MTQKMIQTTGLTKSYHKKNVVNDVDLSVEAGSIYGFLGPNGAGKSTTMKMLLGLVSADRGSIQMMGRPMNPKNRLEILRQTGSLIESPSYYGHMTGQENLELLASMKQVPQKQVAKVLEIVHLTEAKDKKASQYSLGMKQRLGLAGALLGFPKLLLLDEPTNGLDPSGIQEIRRLICSLPQRYGMTVLVSSHLLSEIDQMATHVGIIDKGNLIFQDSLSVLHENSRPSLFLRTSNNEAALLLLSSRGYRPENKGNLIRLDFLTDEEVCRLGHLLGAGGISILRLTEEQKSLEDIFLHLTGRSFA